MILIECCRKFEIIPLKFIISYFSVDSYSFEGFIMRQSPYVTLFYHSQTPSWCDLFSNNMIRSSINILANMSLTFAICGVVQILRNI